MSQNVTLSARISAAGSQRAGVESRHVGIAPRFATPFALVYRCSKFTQKAPLCATFWTSRRGSEAAQLARQGVAAS